MYKSCIYIAPYSILLSVVELKNGQVNVVHQDHQYIYGQHEKDIVLIRIKDIMRVYIEKIDTYEIHKDNRYILKNIKVQPNVENYLSKLGYTYIEIASEDYLQYIYTNIVNSYCNHSSTPASSYVLIGIDAGYTYIMAGKKDKIKYSMVIDQLNLLTLNHNHIYHDPPYEEEINQCRKYVKKQLNKLSFDKKATLIGFGAIPTALAWIDQQLNSYDIKRLDHYPLTKTSISQFFQLLCGHSFEQLKPLWPLSMPVPYTVLQMGVIVLDELIKCTPYLKLITSTCSISHVYFDKVYNLLNDTKKNTKK